MISQSLWAQTGINTTTPNGALDINSQTSGVVLPRVALTATNVMAPVTNPQTGAIPAGTTVYNTNSTFTGSNDVSPGMYTWDGSNWITQFNRKQSELFESSLAIRPTSSGGFENVTGLTGRSFTADFTGEYRVIIHVNFGGGDAKVPVTSGPPGGRSDGALNVARQSGTFRLAFDGVNYDIPAYCYSTAYDSGVGATNYFAIWEQFSTVFYTTFDAGETINFSMTFDQDPAPEFVNDGNSGGGRGYIAYDIPCTVEITYVGD